jgi:hypothetical protein
MLPVHVRPPEPQEVLVSGKVQAPVAASQSVAPQGVAVIVQAVWVQQCPVPLMPQTPETQTSFEAQAPFVTCGAQVPALQ